MPASSVPIDGSLDSHRGYDPGSLELARACARRLQAPLHFATVTRLLVELNRSPGHRALFSAITKSLPRANATHCSRDYYLPYRQRVEADMAQAIADGRRAVHFSMHTFTPKLDGKVRRADIGLLYDPRRPGEAALCAVDSTKSPVTASRSARPHELSLPGKSGRIYDDPPQEVVSRLVRRHRNRGQSEVAAGRSTQPGGDSSATCPGRSNRLCASRSARKVRSR